MFKKLFANKSKNQISLFLANNKVVICKLVDQKVQFVAQQAVTSESQWSDAVQALIAKQQLQGAMVSVVLERSFYQTFDVEKPKVAEAELAASLPFTIKDLVTESVFDLVVDYYDMPLQQHKGEQVTVICLPKKRVIDIRDMILATGSSLESITVEELSLTQLLGDSEETNILLSQQPNELVLTVVKNGQLYFSHRVRGFNEYLNLPLAEVESALVDGLSLELQRALDYISSQLRITSINHLYLGLSCPDLPELAEKLGEYLGRNVLPLAEQGCYEYEHLLAYGVLVKGDAS